MPYLDNGHPQTETPRAGRSEGRDARGSRSQALNRFDVFHERHAKEVLDLFRRSQAESLVKADRAFEGRRRVEGNSLAISFAEMRFRPHQQLCRNPAALLSGNNGHSPDVAFCRVDDSASDRSDDFSGFLVCYKYGHPLKAIRNRVPARTVSANAPDV